VQLQLLTATVKLFLKNPTDSEALVQAVLSAATEHSDNPDLRDRGYIYWRLLSSDPDAAKAVVLADRPVIQDDTNSLDPALLDTLIRNISTLASVYHKPPESFIRRARPAGAFTDGEEEEDEEEGDIYDEGETAGQGSAAEARGASSNDDDLLGLGGGAPAPVASSGGGGLDDLFGFGGGAAPRSAAPALAAVPSYPVLGEKDGLVVRGAFVRRNGLPALDLVVDNSNSAVPVGATALKFNSNSLGLSPNSPNVVFSPAVNSGASGYVSVPVVFNSALVGGANSAIVQAAMRDNGSGRVVFFNVPVAYEALFSEDGESFDRSEFVSQWKSLSGDKEVAEVAKSVASTDPSVVQQKLKTKNLFFMAQRPGPDPSLTLAYFVARSLDTSGASSGAVVLVELTFKSGLNAVKVVVKSPNGDPITKLGIAAVKSALA
jgi:AP-1 complex subunit beta-1